ncbi:MAG TPA: PIN domain-containing protein [Jatrophihabitantaceae bacterium]|nr:PIN domain-containing protein [Jatrophihabitantaceae bacterium]
MIVDTSALLAFYLAREPMHAAVRDALLASTDQLIISPYVVAELDHLVATREGVPSELAVLRDLAGGAWTLASFDGDDLTAAIGIIERYADLKIGLADASNVVLADRYSTRTIATLDRRHFGTLRPLHGGRFSLVP